MCCPAVVPEWLFLLYQAAIGFPPILEGNRAGSCLLPGAELGRDCPVQLYSTSAAAKGSGRSDLH